MKTKEYIIQNISNEKRLLKYCSDNAIDDYNDYDS